MIPSSGVPPSARMRPSDAYFEIIADTLESLDPSARAQFLQRFFLALAHVEIPENKAQALWDEVLTRRVHLSERLDSPVAFQTALVDVLTSGGMFRVPVVLEYDEVKNLHRSAITDPLTGLYNRRLFNETFEKELNRARRYSHPLSLVSLDLHRFKEVNDQHGHPRGDEVLRSAASTFKKALRTSDYAFRIGGDEFALLLPQTDSAQASALSRRVGIVFAEHLRPLNLSVHVAMDSGVVTYPQDSESADELIRLADDRLYEVKQLSHQRAESSQKADSPTAVSAPQQIHPPASSPETAAPPSEPAATTQPEQSRESHSASAPAATHQPAAESHPSSPLVQPAVEPPAAPIPEPPAPPPPPPSPQSLSPLQTSAPAFAAAHEEHRLYAVPRKAERVSMSGTNAYAVLGDQSSHRARVVDLGFGGVALDFASAEGIPDTLLAVLHVPILPPVRVSLKRVWTKKVAEDTVRVGCCFVS